MVKRRRLKEVIRKLGQKSWGLNSTGYVCRLGRWSDEGITVDVSLYDSFVVALKSCTWLRRMTNDFKQMSVTKAYPGIM